MKNFYPMFIINLWTKKVKFNMTHPQCLKAFYIETQDLKLFFFWLYCWILQIVRAIDIKGTLQHWSYKSPLLFFIVEHLLCARMLCQELHIHDIIWFLWWPYQGLSFHSWRNWASEKLVSRDLKLRVGPVWFQSMCFFCSSMLPTWA